MKGLSFGCTHEMLCKQTKYYVCKYFHRSITHKESLISYCKTRNAQNVDRIVSCTAATLVSVNLFIIKNLHVFAGNYFLKKHLVSGYSYTLPINVKSCDK